ncbi:hypothetical protein EJ06DRAFT_539286 [Trichodelitschia bisporula]|uniref:Uncharacterized protein n=1 Tax=Trichodelitschia bisporula TaxID=703511 RepID=A0A6G1HPK8_9PEZI|nr:hypothetical protein EJ06DRAFT_539286 [Trichodelitschia bisporula]
MEAKPLRPRGVTRVRDENAPVAQSGPGKLLHQRTKSASALSTLLKNGMNGIKANPQRRTAFADVSNTSKTVARDDNALPAKGSDGPVKKALQPLKEVSENSALKTAALLRPAQRPLSSIVLKSAVPSSVNISTQVKSEGVELPVEAPIARKTLTKRSTTIFRETAPARRTTILLTKKTRGPPLCSPQLKPSAEKVVLPPVEAAAVPLPLDDLSLPPLAALDSAVEHEEYWLEEEEDEYFDAEGYTTSHSVPSRGDNTTSGFTAVLAPKVTARVQRELESAKIFVDATRPSEMEDEESWDTSMVAEYSEEIFAYMQKLEDRMTPSANYMNTQTEIQWSMRAVLVDWLIQVHARFQLLPETLFLAVNYVDRFLSVKVVSLGKLQLVGATAILLAAKYEEINCPSVQEIVYMVDSGYTADEILKAERYMLSMLDFELGWPGPMSFLRRISKADDYDLETRTLAKYFLEVMIMDERFVGCLPSFAAAGAHCLARLLLNKGDWGPAHVHYSQYTYSQLRTLLSITIECCDNPRKHHSAVYDKYTASRFKRASIFVEAELARGFILPPAGRDSCGSQSLRKR